MNGMTRDILKTTLGGDPTVHQAQIAAAIALLDGRSSLGSDNPGLLVNQAGAARLLNVSRFTIRRMELDGILRPVHLRSAKRYRVQDLEKIAGLA